MNARRQPADGNGPKGVGDSAVRGILLVVIAVAIGVFVLARGLDSSSSSSSSTKPTTAPTTTVKGATTTVAGATTTTVAAAFKVVVANASGKQGAAGKETETLKGKGLTMVDPVTATTKSATTFVYYEPGFEAAAQTTATAVGVTPDKVKPLPNPAPVPTLNGAQVLVLLGSDLAK